jgi:hypothetical protein
MLCVLHTYISYVRAGCGLGVCCDCITGAQKHLRVIMLCVLHTYISYVRAGCGLGLFCDCITGAQKHLRVIMLCVLHTYISYVRAGCGLGLCCDCVTIAQKHLCVIMLCVLHMFSYRACVQDVDWEFAVIASRVPNAFVVPGGKVSEGRALIRLVHQPEAYVGWHCP